MVEHAVDNLRLDPHNANKGSDRGRQLVVSSLEECGAGRSILADREGVVIAGNKTLEAGAQARPAGAHDRDRRRELVVVCRSDLDLASDEKARRLAYLDNRASELGLEWDVQQLLADLEAGVISPASSIDRSSTRCWRGSRRPAWVIPTKCSRCPAGQWHS